MAEIQGSCLCGGVRYRLDGRIGPIGQCHCSRCRKVSGTAGNAVCHVAAASLAWLQGEAQIASYEVPDSDGWLSAFCSTCGSPVPHLDPTGKIYFVPAGTLDGDPGHRGMAAHIYVGSKAPWEVITDDAPQYVAGFDSARLDDRQ